MSMRFTIGGKPAATANLPPSLVRRGEAAVRTGDHAGHDYPRWCAEFWVYPEQWMKTGGVWAPMQLFACQNAELRAYNDAGTLRFSPRFHMWDPSMADHLYTLNPLTLTMNAWNFIRILQDLKQGWIAAWLGATLVHSATNFGTGDSGYVAPQRYAISLLGTDTEIAIDTAPTAAGSVVLDNFRFSTWRDGDTLPYSLANMAPPTGHFTDLGTPALFVWQMRETQMPVLINPQFGTYSGIPRLDAFANRYAGPWGLVANAIANPVP